MADSKLNISSNDKIKNRTCSKRKVTDVTEFETNNKHTTRRSCLKGNRFCKLTRSTCNTDTARINHARKIIKEYKSFDLHTSENAKCKKQSNKIENILEIEDSDNITICPQDTVNSAENVNRSHFLGYTHDEYMNIYKRDEDNYCVNNCCQDRSESQENERTEDNKYVKSVININNKSPVLITLSFSNILSNVNNEISRIFGTLNWKNKLENASRLPKALDVQEVVKQTLEKIKKDYQEVTDFKDTKGTETKPFNTEVNDEIDDLLKLFLPQTHFHIKANIVVYNAESKWHPQAIDDIPWSWLNEEKWRLHTFSRYPHSANKSAILLAEAGFAYIGSGKGSDDKVICFFCCSVKQDWRTSDIITLVHKDLSPDCSMVTGINCNNVPMNRPENGCHLFVQLQQSRDCVYAHEEEKQKAGHELNRDNIEADSACASEQNANQRQQNLPATSHGNNRNIPPAHVAKPLQMASQTVMRPTDSISSASGHSNYNAAVTNRHQTNETQESQNNISSSRPAAAVVETPVQASTQSTQQLEHTTASSAAVSSQVNQVAVSSSALAVSAATSNSTTNTSSVAASNTSNITQNTNPPQVQGNVSQTATGEARAGGRNPTYGELGIITERPKRYEFAVRAKRYESFEPWPLDHHLKKEDLADAGFYYAGYGDCARCFYCGGGLRNWEDDDNVWVEHARWFPKCAFIRQSMGQQFVDAVQDLNKSNEQITYEMVTTKMGGSAASFQLDTKNMPLKRDPAVMTVLDMGYYEKDVLEAANFVKESSGFLSADKLFEKLEQDGKPRNKETKPLPPDSQAVSSTSDVSKDEVVMNELKEQNSQLRQQTVCKICMDKEVAVVFLPCGHLVSCTECAAALKDCPVCRNPVRGIVRAFMA